MSTMRELKRRIKSITGTQQMTQAMKMVSVSKYNRALAQYSAFADYQVQCRRLQAALGNPGIKLEPDRQIRSVCYVVLTANRGLCGDYNLQVIRCLRSRIDQQTLPWKVIMCGKWGQENITDIPFEPFSLPDIPQWEQADVLSKKLAEMFRNGEADEILFVYQQFKNVITQTPICERFLPDACEDIAQADGFEDYLFVPNRAALEQALLERCLCAQVYEKLLAAAAGSLGSMMMTMRTAADNSAAMLEKLSLKMNRMRQSAVTTQVIEIASASLQEDETT